MYLFNHTCILFKQIVEMAHFSSTLSILLIIVVFVGSCGKVVSVHKVSAVIVFGDSTVDAGNNNQIKSIVKSNFKPYGRDFKDGKPTGRFCNGRIATDFISEAFGLKPTIPAYLDPSYSIKDFATGVTFASAGTGLDNITSTLVQVIPPWKQIEMFKEYQRKLIALQGKKRAMETIQEAVYIISIGTNDFILNYFPVPGRSSEFTVEEYEDFLVGNAKNFVLELYRLGARKVSLGGVPPIGCLPLIRTINFITNGACKEELNDLSRQFDSKLKGLVIKLRYTVPGLKLVFSEIYSPALEVIHKPYLYGFENAAQGCCGSGTIELGFLCEKLDSLACTDSSKYAFWDAVHPSEKFNSIVVGRLMKTSLREFV